MKNTWFSTTEMAVWLEHVFGPDQNGCTQGRNMCGKWYVLYLFTWSRWQLTRGGFSSISQ